MLTHKAFDMMLKSCEIRAKDLAAISGVSESRISQFRNGLFLAGKGSDITSKALDDLLEAAQALHPDALWAYSCYRCDREPEEFDRGRGDEEKEKLSGALAVKGADFREALEQTLTDFHISTQWLAQQSGVSQRLISGFCQGRQPLQTDSLEKVICTLPNEARWHFFSSILGGSLDPEQAIRYMNSEQLSGMLFAIAQKINQPSASEQERSFEKVVRPGPCQEKGRLEVALS